MAEIKMILELIGRVAWPATILTIALIYRKPIYDLLFHFGGIADRAAKQAAKISAGRFKIEFTEAVAAKIRRTSPILLKLRPISREAFFPMVFPLPVALASSSALMPLLPATSTFADFHPEQRLRILTREKFC
jgi:hypothetical protein